MDYFVLLLDSEAGGAVIDAFPKGSPADWKFDEGISLARAFPRNGSVIFSRNFLQLRKLLDFQPNILNTLIVSARARKVIEALGVTNAEFLPVAVKDHKGKVAAEDYAILNLLGGEDAIDMERSRFQMNRIDKDQVARFFELAVNPKGIDADARLFRCSRARRVFLVRQDARDALARAGLTGLRMVPAEGWNGQE
jgi:hypothetical protein